MQVEVEQVYLTVEVDGVRTATANTTHVEDERKKEGYEGEQDTKSVSPLGILKNTRKTKAVWCGWYNGNKDRQGTKSRCPSDPATPCCCRPDHLHASRLSAPFKYAHGAQNTDSLENNSMKR